MGPVGSGFWEWTAAGMGGGTGAVPGRGANTGKAATPGTGTGTGSGNKSDWSRLPGVVDRSDGTGVGVGVESGAGACKWAEDGVDVVDDAGSGWMTGGSAAGVGAGFRTTFNRSNMVRNPASKVS